MMPDCPDAKQSFQRAAGRVAHTPAAIARQMGAWYSCVCAGSNEGAWYSCAGLNGERGIAACVRD
eukprot:352242-Chlamydomonas_euryale.AAC.1